jgi:4-hydroxymandelate oxidase
MPRRANNPIVITPTGSNRAFHPDGELAVARAAKAGNHLQILSSVATTTIEDTIAARDAPVWFQLYPTQRWEIGEALVQRAQQAGCPVIVVTLDVVSPLKWETLARLRRIDTRQCGTCHSSNGYLAGKPNFDGIDLRGITGITAPNLTWDFITRLRASIKAKIVLKGILTREDAKLAADNGIDGIIVSNHGGRVVHSGYATIEVLSEVVEAVGSRIPVLVGRGTDVIKALAMGAVCIGRPYLWGLGPSVSLVSSASLKSFETRRALPCSRLVRRQSASYAGYCAESLTQMHLDLTDEESFVLLNLLTETVENDRHPLST